MSRSRRALHWPAVVSVAVTGLLTLIGVVRLLSYSRATLVGEFLSTSLLRHIAYRPTDYFSVQFFKIVATPTVVSMMYFLFRLMNRSHNRALPPSYAGTRRDMDFRSPLLRLLLTSLVSLHWLVMELAKFSSDDFYPNSPLEDQSLNALILLVSQLIAFLGMKYLSFEPLFKERQRDPRGPAG